MTKKNREMCDKKIWLIFTRITHIYIEKKN